MSFHFITHNSFVVVSLGCFQHLMMLSIAPLEIYLVRKNCDVFNTCFTHCNFSVSLIMYHTVPAHFSSLQLREKGYDNPVEEGKKAHGRRESEIE